MSLKCQGTAFSILSIWINLYRVKFDEQGSLNTLKSTLPGKIFYVRKYMHSAFSAHNIFLSFYIWKLLKSVCNPLKFLRESQNFSSKIFSNQ